jgi:hypothetical protein
MLKSRQTFTRSALFLIVFLEAFLWLSIRSKPVSIAFNDKIFELKRTRVFVVPPIRQYFKVNIHSVGTPSSLRFEWVKHGYMSISPPNSHPIIDHEEPH